MPLSGGAPLVVLTALAFCAITAAEEKLVGMGIYLVSFLLISLMLAGYPKAQDEMFAFK